MQPVLAVQFKMWFLQLVWALPSGLFAEFGSSKGLAVYVHGFAAYVFDQNPPYDSLLIQLCDL